MKCNEAGLKLLTTFEGFSATHYLCPAGVWTIGYGHTGKDVDTYEGYITKEQGIEILRKDVLTAEKAVSRLIHAPLTSNQFSALVCFTYNLGAGALQRASFRQKINRGEHTDVPLELMKWCRVGTRKLPGLIRRRKAEGLLYAA